MQGDESQSQDESEVVLWRNVSTPVRTPKRLLPSWITGFYGRYEWVFSLIGLAILGWMTWQNFRDPSPQFPRDALWLLGPVIGVMLGTQLGRHFKFQMPVSPGTPHKLTDDRLFFSAQDPSSVETKDIRGVSTSYHEGSPSILIGLANRSLTLVTSDRVGLLKALLSIRPDLAPAS